MLTSQVIYLKLLHGDPQNISGNHIHGFFFKEILASQNPQLGDWLHSPDNPKLFSLSYIYKSGELHWFRICSWTDDIAKAVFAYFNSVSRIKLSDCVFELIKTCTDAKESLWAKRISQDYFIAECEAMDKDTFWIEHYSPTSFKCGDSHLPLPVPERIIKSVFRQLPENLIKNIISNLDELAEVLQLKQHQITSVYNRKNHGSIASFTGKTRWQISKKADRRQKQDIWKLLHFAFYSGIGVKTTQGMGMCRVHYQGDE